MKLKFNHPEPSARELSGPRYWRSLDDLAGTPAFKDWVDKEFPVGASFLEEVDRRSFLKIMAASFGLAGMGLAGCRQQTKHLLPYSKQPDRIIPGVPVFYASSKPGSDESIPLIVETHDARPTKVEGNPSYTPMGGATDVFSQSSVLDLYDADRAQQSSSTNGAPLSVAAVSDKLNAIAAKYAANGGTGLYFLADRSTSPTRARVVKTLQTKYPKAVWAEYEPIDQSNPERAATMLFKERARPVYDFSKAKRVLSLDSDFLHTEPGNIAYARGFADSRRVANAADADPEKMVRLYCIESNFSLTGANADHRLRCATSHIWGITTLMLAEVLSQLDAARNQGTVTLLKQMAQGITDLDSKWIAECAKDLVAHPGKSTVIAGAALPPQIHLMVMVMNTALGAVGSTLNYLKLPEQTAPANIADVSRAIDAKQVETLVILNGNPAYNAPGDLNFAAKLASVPDVVRYGYYGRQADETSALANTFIAGLHYLESWGDGYTWNGTYVPVQPMILPLFKGWGEIDVLAQIAGDPNADAFAYVKETFAALKPGKTLDQWLAEGTAGTPFPAVTTPVTFDRVQSLAGWSAEFEAPAVNDKALEVRFVPGGVGDGRYANNGWLQEAPDSMTKLTWDNAILVSPRLGKQLGLFSPTSVLNEMGQSAMNANTFVTGREMAKMAEVTVNGKVLKGPVSILPGLANWSLVVALGYGRTLAGRVGTGVGFNAYTVTKSSGAVKCAASGATIKILDEKYPMANVQEHWSMEGRELIREANVEEYHVNPEFAKSIGMEPHSPPIFGPDKDMSPEEKAVKVPRGQTLYTPHPYDKPAPNYPVWNTKEGLEKFPTPQQWGMSIDLNTCLACTACVVACQAENNIPIVGKDQVMRGREMHWIRLDRYFASGPDANGKIPTTDLPEDPQVSFQSMACQHCELAPCENVCPFMATVHDDQGLNTMAYNRCVGTKYCANNCPFKVRRFNFFDWNKREVGHFYEGPLGPDYYQTEASQLTRMQKNPDVSVRMRGVMEKCTYCVQRIEEAKINQRIKAQDSGNIKVADGAIVPACAQVCPTDSIVFGDVSDPTTAVAKAKQSDRNYGVLTYLNIRPRTTYLAKLRNPNPAMPDYRTQPLARLEQETRYGHHGAAAEHGEAKGHEAAAGAEAPKH